MCHPATPSALADKLLNLLRRLLQLVSRSQPLSTTPMFDGDALIQHLVNLGGVPTGAVGKETEVVVPKRDDVEEDDDDDDDELMELDAINTRPTPPPRPQTKLLTSDARVSAVDRWCKTLQILPAT